MTTSTPNSTSGDGEKSTDGDAPLNWSGRWGHIPLNPGSTDKPRQPVVPLPENVADGDEGRLRYSQLYWQGIRGNWSDLTNVIAGGKHVGLLPERSGLVVLDCDKKLYDEGTGYTVNGNHATITGAVARYGIDDLSRAVAELGHSTQELATYTVATKSGGLHLYYQVNPRFQLGTKHHRHEWRVDVISSPNSWIVAPPTPGYSVVRDLPVAVLPDWLAAWLMELERHILPLGGKRAKAIRDRAGIIKCATQPIPGVGEAPDGTDMFTRWIRLELAVVQVANQEGGWNAAIYQCAMNLFDACLPLSNVTGWLLQAGQPTDNREERRLLDTVNSAHKKHLRVCAGCRNRSAA